MKKIVCKHTLVAFAVLILMTMGACEQNPSNGGNTNNGGNTGNGGDAGSGGGGGNANITGTCTQISTSSTPTMCIQGNTERSSGTDAQISACNAASGTSATAQYTVTFMTNWSISCSRSSRTMLPGGAHFTTLTGTTHTSAYKMWRVGEKATVGVEQLAETGGNDTLKSEITAAGSETAVLVEINNPGAKGSRGVSCTFGKNQPLLSLESMIAPTADWFVGLSSYCLLDSSGDWKSDVTIPLRVYDAGTEQDSPLFSLGNSAENPHKNISTFLGSAEAGFQSGNEFIGAIRLQKM